MCFRASVMSGAFGLVVFATAGFAAEPAAKSVAALFAERAALNGQEVQVAGRVVKVTNNVMNRNFLHIQDGSGTEDARDNDLTVTSDQTAEIGDDVVVTGTVATDVDFGMGYTYPLMLQKASISRASATQ